MVCGVRWQWVVGAFAFVVVWYACALPLITDGILTDIQQVTAGFGGPALAAHFVGMFVLAMSPPIVAIGEVVHYALERRVAC